MKGSHTMKPPKPAAPKPKVASKSAVTIPTKNKIVAALSKMMKKG